VDYLELSLAVRPDAVEAAADTLRRYTPAGVSIEPTAEATDEDGGVRIDPDAPVRLRAWLPADAESRVAVTALRKELRGLGDGIVRPLRARTVKDTSWADMWKRYFRTLRIGHRIVIKPSWRLYRLRKNDVLIELDPGMAFGTGQHATTQLCLEAMEELLPDGARVLDVGCGSGILSIAAALLGASYVDALDIDPMAVRATGDNAARNGVGKVVRVANGTLGEGWPFGDPAGSRYDIVVANLSSRLVQSLAAELLAALAPGGVLIASGVIEEQEPACRRALESARGHVDDVRQREGWVAFVVRHALGAAL
jgi:ribosomal protein L11 methyltransferase